MNITKDQFKGLSTNKKLDVLFDNQCETIILIKGYKFYQKISATIGSFLVVGAGIIFKMHFT